MKDFMGLTRDHAESQGKTEPCCCILHVILVIIIKVYACSKILQLKLICDTEIERYYAKVRHQTKSSVYKENVLGLVPLL